MAIAAGAVLLRSAATKMARAPPRLPYALEHHGRLPTSSSGLCLSRFSTSSGRSMPPSSANLRGPQIRNNEVPSDSHWYRFMVAFNQAAIIGVFYLFSGIAYLHFRVNPALDRIKANMDA